MKPYYSSPGIGIYHGDALTILRELESESVNCCVTSPPYWGLRDYGVEGQLGLERTPEEYVSRMVEVFGEIKRVLRDDGTIWVNMGDSYCGSFGAQGRGEDAAPLSDKQSSGRPITVWPEKPPNRKINGLKPKDLVGVPWMLAFALRADGWYLRSDIIWSKPNPMPESVTDRPTKAHEYIFLLSKSEQYYYDQDSILEPVSENTHMRLSQNLPAQIGSERANGGTERNKRTVWSINVQGFAEAHFATFPEELIKPCILAGCPAGGTVLDPFMGSGTTALVARANGCYAIGIELNSNYIGIAAKRLAQEVLPFV